MKKAYSSVAYFARWVVAGVLSVIAAIPTVASFSTSL